MVEEADVVIAGGGVVGSACAYYLRKHGYAGKVLIVEKDPTYAYSCTARSAGGIRQQFSTPENIALSKFGLDLILNLKAEFGPEADAGFKEQGYLLLASEEGAEILEQNHAVQMANGAVNTLLSPRALRERFPWIEVGGVALGCFGLSGEGWLDPYSLMTLLRKGSEVVTGNINRIDLTGTHVTSVRLSDGREIACKTLVNACGTGAGALAHMVGVSLPVGPRKRYVYVIDCPTAPDELHAAPLTVDPSGFYFRPEGRHFITGLSPEELEEPLTLDWEVDYAWFEDRIWPGLAERVPAFEAIKVINAWVGHYDYNSLDQNAIIGPHPEIDNFYFANGFSGHGLQQGPAVGNAIAELIVHGGYRAIDLRRLGYDRVRRNQPLFERNVI